MTFLENFSYSELLYVFIFTLIWTEYLWELYLSVRQYKVIERTTKVPKELENVIDQKNFDKSRMYAIDRNKFSNFHETFNIIITTIIIKYYLINYFWKQGTTLGDYLNLPDSEYTHTAMFLLVVNVFTKILGLPLSIYSDFVIEERHGFNKQTAGFYAKDQIKKFLVTQILLLPLSLGCVYTIKMGGEYFFIYLWLFATAVVFFFMTIYPDFIAPLFDKYTPLQDGDLKTKIETLAKSVEFPLFKLYVVEGSKRSAHSNAYFYGFHKNKRIVIFDTLIKGYTKENDDKGCETDEILAVLCHELGHWYHNHVAKNIVITQVNLLLQFFVFGLLFKYSVIYEVFGFTDEQPVLVGLLIIIQYILAPYNTALSCFMTYLTRTYEVQADDFAIGKNRGEQLKKALIKLSTDNLSFPVYDWLYSAWHHSHPTLLQRIEHIDQKNN